MVLGFGKKKGTRQSKRKKGSSSNANQEELYQENEDVPMVEQVEQFPEVVFIDDAHRNRFVTLLGISFVPTQFIDGALLEKLGIYEQTRAFFEGMGLGLMFGMYEETYYSLSLEFLCSLRVYNDEQVGVCLEFRLHNETRRLTFAEFAEIFGLPMPANFTKPKGFSESFVWKAISGLPLTDFKNLYATQIQHPVIRIGQCFLAGTIICKKETGKVSQKELAYFESYLKVQGLDYTFHPTLELITRLRKIGDCTASSTGIMVGGLITRIAMTLCPNFNDGGEYYTSPGPTLLNEKALVNNQRWLTVSDEGGFYWHTSGRDSYVLPNENLPHTNPRRSLREARISYCLPIEDGDDDGARNRLQQQQNQPRWDQGEPSSSHYSTPQQGYGIPPFLYGVQPSYADIPPYPHQHEPLVRPPRATPPSPTDFLVDLMHNLDTRMYRGHEDNYYAQYPQYYHLAQNGWIDPNGPTPSWVNRERMFPNYDGNNNNNNNRNNNEGEGN